jgi:hypothetical protein
MWTQAVGIAGVTMARTFGGFATGAVLLGIGTAMVYPTLIAVIGDVAHPGLARDVAWCLSLLA